MTLSKYQIIALTSIAENGDNAGTGWCEVGVIPPNGRSELDALEKLGAVEFSGPHLARLLPKALCLLVIEDEESDNIGKELLSCAALNVLAGLKKG